MTEKVEVLKNHIQGFIAKTNSELEEFRLKFISKKGEFSQLFEERESIVDCP